MADSDDLNINITGKADGLDAASKKAKASLSGVADSAKAIEAAFKTVAKAIDPTAVALDRYNKAQAANALLLKENIVTATQWANTQVKLRQEYDASVVAIQRRTAAGRAEVAESKRLAAEAVAAEKSRVAEEKRLASEAAAVRKAEAKAAGEVERAEKRALRDQARADAAEAKRLSREQLAAERADRKAEADAARQANRDKKAAARDAAAAAKQAARDAATAARDEKRANREAADAIEQKARAERQSVAAAQELRASIDPAYASQMRYNQTMATATGLLMDNKLKQGEWIAIQKQAATQMQINTRSMGRMNSVYVQLGYQAQDVTAQLASGTNPLVILAQQGGQTAAAMSMLGGRMGKVAAFLAGPWGAAIIGATLLLGYLLQSSKDNEKATLNLMDAESRRAAKLPDLTSALEDFARAQREANTSEEEALRLKGQMVVEETRSTNTQLAAAEARLKALQARAALAAKVPTTGLTAEGKLVQVAALTALSIMIKRAQNEVDLLKRNLNALGTGGVEVDITASIQRAAAAADALTAAKQEHDKVETGINNLYRERRAVIDRIADSKLREQKLNELNANADAKRLKLARDYAAIQKKINDDKRQSADNNNATAQFMMPVPGRITSAFGHRSSPGEGASTNHEGVDIYAKLNTAVRAAADGVVKFSHATEGGYGNLIKISHGAGTESRYGHLSSMTVTPGQEVKKGDIIGYSGGAKGAPGAGNSTGPHLHFEIRVNGKPVDPTKGTYHVDPGDASTAGAAAAAQEAAANEAEAERKRAAKEAHDDAIADLDFKQTLAGEDLQTVLSLQDQKIAAQKAFYGEDSKEAKKAGQERILIERRIAAQELADSQASLREQLSAMKQIEQARADVAATGREIQTDNISTAESTGMISPEVARREKARVLDEEFADQAAHEARMYDLELAEKMDELRLKDLPLSEQRRINAEIVSLQAEHLDKMRSLELGYQADVNRVRNEAFAAQTAKWRDMASTITGSMRQAFTGIWTHQTTFFQTMINMADAIVYKFADMGEKVLEDWIVKQAVKMGLIHAQQATETGAVVAGEATRTAAKATGEATREGIGATGVVVHTVQEGAKTGASITGQAVQTGAKVAGEATRGSVGAAGAIAEIGTRAATSAAGAFSSTVVIPFIGPVAAPVAAAAALAAVLGFAALVSARGGQEKVPMDGQITELHKEEMVLPAWMANPFRESLRNPAARGASAMAATQAAASAGREAMGQGGDSSTQNFYYQPKHHNMGASLDTLLKKDGASLRRWMRNELRNGSFTV